MDRTIRDSLGEHLVACVRPFGFHDGARWRRSAEKPWRAASEYPPTCFSRENKIAQAKADLARTNAAIRIFEIGGDTGAFILFVPLARARGGAERRRRFSLIDGGARGRAAAGAAAGAALELGGSASPPPRSQQHGDGLRTCSRSGIQAERERGEFASQGGRVYPLCPSRARARRRRASPPIFFDRRRRARGRPARVRGAIEVIAAPAAPATR